MCYPVNEQSISKVSKNRKKCRKSCAQKVPTQCIWNATRMTKFASWKKNNEKLDCSVQIACTFSDHEQNICKVLKRRSNEIVEGVALTTCQPSDSRANFNSLLETKWYRRGGTLALESHQNNYNLYFSQVIFVGARSQNYSQGWIYRYFTVVCNTILPFAHSEFSSAYAESTKSTLICRYRSWDFTWRAIFHLCTSS